MTVKIQSKKRFHSRGAGSGTAEFYQIALVVSVCCRPDYCRMEKTRPGFSSRIARRASSGIPASRSCGTKRRSM